MVFFIALVGLLNHLAWGIFAIFNAKARLIVKGRKATAGRLRSKLEAGRPVVWFHVASLGEFEQGRPLMEATRQAHPHWQILVSFFSPSGYEVRHDWSGADCVVYLPEDSPRAVRQFLKEANPSFAIFVKYDFWPVMLAELRRQAIPTYLVSAIFRPRQFFFHPLGGYYLRLLHYFDFLWVQDKESVELLTKHGVFHTDVAGDTRFDRAYSIAQESCDLPEAQALRQRKAKLIVAGSTHPQDEEALSSYLAKDSEVGLILAPHEIDEAHLQAIEATLPRPSVRLSQLRQGEGNQQADIIIIDNFGLLATLYRYADVAYIGGGFGKGIHNTVEAAVYGIPLVFGPRIEKFREAQLFVREGVASVAQSPDEVGQILHNLFAHPDQRREMAQRAQQIIATQLGATAILMENLGLAKSVDIEDVRL